MAEFVITDYTENRFEHEVTNRLMAVLNIKAKFYVLRNSINSNGKNQGSSCNAYDLDEVLYKLKWYLENARRKNTQNYEIAKLLIERIENDTSSN